MRQNSNVTRLKSLQNSKWDNLKTPNETKLKTLNGKKIKTKM